MHKGAGWDFDVLVCGSNMLGTGLLAALRLSGETQLMKLGQVSSLPAHSSSSSSPPTSLSPVHVLTATNVSFLQSLGIWDGLKQRSQCILAAQVWDHAGPGVVRVTANDMGVPELGRCVAAEALESALKAAASAGTDMASPVTALEGWHVVSVELPKDEREPATVILADVAGTTRTVTSRLVVGCDAAMASQARRSAGMRQYSVDSGRVVVQATVDVSEQHETVWQRYLPSGPLALLPLWESRSLVQWCTSEAEGHRLVALASSDPEAWAAEVNTLLHASPEYTLGALNEGETTVEGAAAPPPADLPLPDPMDWPVPDEVKRGIKQAQERLEGSPLASIFPTHENIADGLEKFARSRQMAKKEIRLAGEALMGAALLKDPYRAPPRVLGLASISVKGTDTCTDVGVSAGAGAVTCVPASSRQSTTYVAPQGRLALVGEGGHSELPLSGRGTSIGMGDIEELTATLGHVLSTGGDIGLARNLVPYSQTQVRKNMTKTGVAEGIDRLYAYNDNDNFKFLRSLGMLAMHGSGAMKTHMARMILGYT